MIMTGGKSRSPGRGDLSQIKGSPVTGLEWPRGFQEVKVPSFHDNST